MKKRVAIVAGVVGALSLVAPAAMFAGASASAAGSDPCVVIHGPNGLTIQVGYAPNGPTGCVVQH